MPVRDINNSAWSVDPDITTTADLSSRPVGNTHPIIYNEDKGVHQGFNGSSWSDLGGGGSLDVVDSSNIKFLSSIGTYYGSYTSPRSGSLVLDTSDSVVGGISVVYYENPTLDIDKTPTHVSGELASSGVNKLYIEVDQEKNITISILPPIEEPFQAVVFTTTSPQLTESPDEIYQSSLTSFNAAGQSAGISGNFEYTIDVDDSSADKDSMFGVSENATFGTWNGPNPWSYGCWIEDNGHLRPLQGGSAGANLDVDTTLTWQSGDKLKFKIVGTSITLLLNDNLIHTFTGGAITTHYLYITPTDQASGQRVRFPRYRSI